MAIVMNSEDGGHKELPRDLRRWLLSVEGQWREAAALGREELLRVLGQRLGYNHMASALREIWTLMPLERKNLKEFEELAHYLLEWVLDDVRNDPSAFGIALPTHPPVT